MRFPFRGPGPRPQLARTGGLDPRSRAGSPSDRSARSGPHASAHGHGLRRLAAATVGAGLGALLLAGTAGAAPSAHLAALPAHAAGHARAAADTPSTMDTLQRFFASAAEATGTHPDATGRAGEPRLVGDPVPVYQLAPGFVAGGDGPVASLTGMAVEAESASGAHATLLTAPDGSGHWSVVNIASGRQETGYAAKARARHDATAFREPQINAWYALRGDRVLPLNADARRSVGAGVTLADYQRLVHDRYADKMPGSGYDRAGTAGGFAADAAGTHPGTAWAVPVVLGAVFAAALAGAALLLRRRRTVG